MYLLQLPFNTLSQDSSYTSWSNLNQVDSFKFASDHVTERLSQSEEKQCGVNGYECDEPSYKDAEIKYTLFKNKKFSIMSYNIWNMNPEAGQKDDYVKRMKRLKQVRLQIIFHSHTCAQVLIYTHAKSIHIYIITYACTHTHIHIPHPIPPVDPHSQCKPWSIDLIIIPALF